MDEGALLDPLPEDAVPEVDEPGTVEEELVYTFVVEDKMLLDPVPGGVELTVGGLVLEELLYALVVDDTTLLDPEPGGVVEEVTPEDVVLLDVAGVDGALLLVLVLVPDGVVVAKLVEDELL